MTRYDWMQLVPAAGNFKYRKSIDICQGVDCIEHLPWEDVHVYAKNKDNARLLCKTTVIIIVCTV